MISRVATIIFEWGYLWLRCLESIKASQRVSGATITTIVTTSLDNANNSNVWSKKVDGLAVHS